MDEEGFFEVTLELAGPIVLGLLMALMAVGSLSSTCWAEPDPGFTLPDTGQKKCYNDLGSVIDCPKESYKAFYGQDAQRNKHDPHFKNRKDGTISDKVTKRLWEYNDGHNSKRSFSLSDAKDYCAELNKNDPSHDPPLPLGGVNVSKRPWRLPTRLELHSIVIYTGVNPAKDEVFPMGGDHTPFYWYDDGDKSDRMSLGRLGNDGPADDPPSDGTASVRCVRWGIPSAEAPVALAAPGETDDGEGAEELEDDPEEDPEDAADPIGYAIKMSTDRFDVGYDGTVLDRQTGMRWTQYNVKNSAIEYDVVYRMNWKDSLKSCVDYVDDSNRKSYRLPNIKELSSLIDSDGKGGLPSDVFFTNGSSDRFEWSSTTSAQPPAYYSGGYDPGPKEAMTVGFYSTKPPVVGDTDKSYTFGYTRCVTGGK